MPDPTSAPSSFVTTAAIALAAVVTLAALASACGSTNHGARSTAVTEPGPTTESSTGSTESSGSPSIAPDDNAAVLAAYQQFWQVWLRANNPPNPDYPDLVTVATGQELDTVRRTAERKIANGTYTRLPPNPRYLHDAAVSSIVAGHAIVTDCWIDDAQVRKMLGDELVNGDVVTELVQGDLDLSESLWRVSNVREEREWPGITDCN